MDREEGIALDVVREQENNGCVRPWLEVFVVNAAVAHSMLLGLDPPAGDIVVSLILSAPYL